MATVAIGIVSSCGLTIDAHCRNKPNKSKRAFCKLLLRFNSCLKGCKEVTRGDASVIRWVWHT